MFLEHDPDRRWPHGWWILPGALVGLLIWWLIVRAVFGGEL